MRLSSIGTSSSIADRIHEYVRENLLYMRPDFALTDDVKLIEHRIIDSMGVLEVIAFLEETFGVVIQDDEVNEANLGTIAAMASFVAIKQRTGPETGAA